MPFQSAITCTLETVLFQKKVCFRNYLKRKELIIIDKDTYKCPETGQGEVCCA